MSVRRTFFKKLAIAFSRLLVLYALFGWLALPRIIQSQAERAVSEKTACRLTLDLPKFNPFTLELELANLHLVEPGGKLLLAFRDLDADFSVSGLFRRTLVLQSVNLDRPQASFVMRKNGKSDWQEFVEKMGGKSSSSPAIRLEIGHFRLAGGRVDFRDESNGFAARMEPVDLDLDDISTWPGKAGRFRLSARTDSGAEVLLAGKMGLSPVALSGNLEIRNLDGKAFSAYLKVASFGKASLFSDFRLTDSGGKTGLNLENVKAQVSGIRVNPAIAVDKIEIGKGSFDLAKEKLSLGFIDISGSRIDSRGREFLKVGTARLKGIDAGFAKRSISVGKIELKNGSLDVIRNEKGEFELPGIPKLSGNSGKPSRPWHYLAKKVALSGFSANLQDRSVSPHASLQLKKIDLNVDGVSDNLSKPLPVRLSLESQDGGSLEVDGRVIPAEKSADLNLGIENLALQPAQPYLASFARLSIASGKVDAHGHAAYGEKGARYQGKFDVKDLRLIEKDTKQVFLSWKSLSSPDLDVTGSKLDIKVLDIDNPYAKLIIAGNKSVNIAEILEKRKSPTHEKISPFQVNIDRVRLKNGEMDYADYSLALPFGTRIHRLHGVINGISSAPGALGQLRLAGRVDQYGSVRAAGQIDLFDPKNTTDIKVKFSNIEMTRLTPYSATFAGRKIDSGKLTLDIDYRIKNHQLTGNNQIIMDNLTLGGRVRSPQAKDLPLDLAIAVLQDSNGRIDLGLPISGSLDDPKFSYGAIIWKAVSRVFEKIVTAPFRMLGALFGGGEKFENIDFDPGRIGLAPPEQEKLSRLANALLKRPRLVLTVHGVYSDADRAALQDLKARRAVDAASGQHIGRHEDPGPLAKSSPAIRDAIERLFAERFGKAELSAIREGFRKANPGKMKEGAVERIESRFSGLFRKKRTLSEAEVEKLKGADFYTVLYGRLRDAERVQDSELQKLGDARGDLIAAGLKASGVPLNRLKLESAVKVQGTGEGVPAKLELCSE